MEEAVGIANELSMFKVHIVLESGSCLYQPEGGCALVGRKFLKLKINQFRYDPVSIGDLGHSGTWRLDLWLVWWQNILKQALPPGTGRIPWVYKTRA